MEIAALIIPSFIAGLLTFLAPCTLPMVPAYLGFIIGTSAHEVLRAHSTRVSYRVLGKGLAFVLGMSSMFMLFGVFAGFLGNLIPGYRIWFARVGGTFIILFGLFMLGVLRVSALSREYRIQIRTPFARGSYANAFALGAAFGTGWTPCVGPVLGSILTLAATSEGALSGAFLLGIFSLGLSVPFLLIALALGTAENIITRMTPYLVWISRVSGVLLIALGVVLATGSMPQFIGFMYRFLSFLKYDSLVQYF